MDSAGAGSTLSSKRRTPRPWRREEQSRELLGELAVPVSAGVASAVFTVSLQAGYAA